MSAEGEPRFRVLWERWRAPVTAYALRRVPGNEDAADVVAETFRVAWQRLDDVPSGEAGLFWLYGVARRVIANQYRGKRRRDALVGRLGAVLRLAGVMEPPVSEDSVAGLRALRRLTEADREVLMLASWEGLDGAGIGRTLGCSPVAARLRLHRARSRLVAALARDEPANRSVTVDPQFGAVAEEAPAQEGAGS